MNLTGLANTFGTDKGTITASGHGYTLLYDLLFAARRDSVTDLCEIGLARGGPEVSDGAVERSVADVPSIRMWHEFFPRARIVGVDISDCSAFANDWFTFVQADCGDAAQLARVGGLGREFDVIVDDGSHAAFHQQQAFLSLFPLLRPGGLFIIEDLHWQPDTYLGHLPQVPRTDILLERYVRTGHFSDTGALDQARWDAAAAQIGSVLMFDDDWLSAHRRQVNAAHGHAPEFETRIDRADSGARGLRGLIGELKRRMKAEVLGRESLARYPEIKLAVITKKGPDSGG
jgi:SAM-dependent methyltransferase